MNHMYGGMVVSHLLCLIQPSYRSSAVFENTTKINQILSHALQRHKFSGTNEMIDICLLLNNSKFSCAKSYEAERNGSEQDIKHLSWTFGKLGFEIIVKFKSRCN